MKILETRQVVDQNGVIHPLKDHISVEEGLFIQDIVKDIKPGISLEIGLAMGVSSMFICEALKGLTNARHIVIDPGQTQKTQYDDWQGIGLHNLSQCNFDDIVEFINEPSEIALPQLLNRHLKIDFAFIDGWHSFDHALLDFFYINRMLRVGGVVVFDDAHFPSIGKAINYIANYPCYQPYKTIRKSINRQGLHAVKKFFYGKLFDRKLHDPISGRYYALRKISEDERSWDWFVNF